MNKLLSVLLIFVFFASVSLVSAQGSTVCTLSAQLINQDPYPSVPGEEVKVVFQLTGVEERSCGQVEFTVLENFPFSVEPGTSATQQIHSGTFSSFEFPSFWLVPFTLIVDEAALDGENELQIEYSSSNFGSEIQEFNITVENLVSDFEVSIKDYVGETQILTFEILNIGESDVEALTIDIPSQENLEIKGSKRNIVGSLDSNEDTTFNFEAIPSAGEIKVEILYTDEIDVRRSVMKTVNFDPNYFEDRARDRQGFSTSFYLLVILIVIIIAIWLRSYFKKRKKKQRSA